MKRPKSSITYLRTKAINQSNEMKMKPRFGLFSYYPYSIGETYENEKRVKRGRRKLKDE